MWRNTVEYIEFDCSCGCLQEFEDLDEITARYVQPMAAFARDLLGHKYFLECNGGERKVCYNKQFLFPFFLFHVIGLYKIACMDVKR